jgi:hypothetical protein
MGFKNDLGNYGEDLVADLLRSRGWLIENVNRTRGANLEWGDIYGVSPSGFSVFFSAKARTAVEHGDLRLICNGSYDGKGYRHFKIALNKLRNWGYTVDSVGWISVAMNLDQTYSAYVGLLEQMMITGCNNKEMPADEWKWSIPMRPSDRNTYLHLQSGRHDFDWSKYSGEWFYEPHRIWVEQGVSPIIHEQKPRKRTRQMLPELFPDLARESFATWDVRAAFGSSSSEAARSDIEELAKSGAE